MKRILFLALFAIAPALAFLACGSGEDEAQAEVPATPETENNGDSSGTQGNGKILIAYFSRVGNTDYPSDVDASTGASIQADSKGTTQTVAEYIQAAVGGDIHLIETTDKYTSDFDDLRDQNHSEQAAGTLPELKSRIENMEQYETVFIGYPVWAMDVPQAIHSFLTSYDFAGKRIIPFCTHDGYGAGSSYSSVRSDVSGATVLDGLAIDSGDMASAEESVREWLARLGIESEENSGTTVTIEADGRTFTGEWLDTPLTQEIRSHLPLTATLGRYGNREFYGSLPFTPTSTEDGQLHFTNGDITYCPANNTIAIFYAKADDPDMGTLTMRIIPIGRVTSDLGAFDEIGSRISFTFR